VQKVYRQTTISRRMELDFELGEQVSDQAHTSKVAWTAPKLIAHAIADITSSKNSTQVDGNSRRHRPSDARLKHNIRAVGSLPNGITVYRYNYIWENTEYLGVMAHEVREILPDAVVQNEDGYLAVDYDQVGMPLIDLSSLSPPTGK
jgi:hypothetical protein